MKERQAALREQGKARAAERTAEAALAAQAKAMACGGGDFQMPESMADGAPEHAALH